jgi:hypothetical protein
MDEVGKRVIRGAMPDQHRAFFTQLSFVVLGAAAGIGAKGASFMLHRCSFPFRALLITTIAVVAYVMYTPPALPADQRIINGSEACFLSESDDAMTRMMDGMSVKPAGNVDKDFVSMMVPHHQGAVDMAQAELRYGHDERLRRIAQEIVVEQKQEIVAMRVALDEPIPPYEPTTAPVLTRDCAAALTHP